MTMLSSSGEAIGLTAGSLSFRAKPEFFSAGAAKESDFYQRIRLLRAWKFPVDDPAELFEKFLRNFSKIVPQMAKG